MDVQRTIDALWRMEAARLIARLTRLVRDVGEIGRASGRERV